MRDRFPRLKERLHTLAGKLPGGEQQMVALGRGLLVRPRLLLVDELSLGLAPVIVEQLIGILTTINAEGVTVLVVEQDVQLPLEQAHYGYVLETGQVVRHGDGVGQQADPTIQQAFLGLNPPPS